MRIAVVGSGVSGLISALEASERGMDVALFEADLRLGGHANTVTVPMGGREVPVDTGFIVFNPARYPIFCETIDRLGVPSKPTRMSFSVRDDTTGFEYGGATLSGLLARRRNALSPRFWSMLAGVRRFSRTATEALEGPHAGETLGEHLARHRYPASFARDYLLPMSGAIWSSAPAQVARFPLDSFVRFFENHGMLTPWRPPQWRTIEGGSRRYVDAVASRLTDVRLSSPVRAVRRTGAGVVITARNRAPELFDAVVIAAHADQALRMLDDPSRLEREILSAFPYQPNRAVLHTDASILPRRPGAWSAWNFLADGRDAAGPCVTYNLDILQSLPNPRPLDRPTLVTLNPGDRIDPSRILTAFDYDHPLFSPRAFATQARWPEIAGARMTWFAGAYWGDGFHEDGARSARRCVESIAHLAGSRRPAGASA